MNELRAKATKFIQMEEMIGFREKMRGESSRKLVDWEVKIESSHSQGNLGPIDFLGPNLATTLC